MSPSTGPVTALRDRPVALRDDLRTRSLWPRRSMPDCWRHLPMSRPYSLRSTAMPEPAARAIVSDDRSTIWLTVDRISSPAIAMARTGASTTGTAAPSYGSGRAMRVAGAIGRRPRCLSPGACSLGGLPPGPRCGIEPLAMIMPRHSRIPGRCWRN